MAETDIIGIGIAYDTSQMLTGTRQVETELRKLESAEKSVQQQTTAMERTQAQAGVTMQRESQAASQAGQALAQQGQAASTAATQMQAAERASSAMETSLQHAGQAASSAGTALERTGQGADSAGRQMGALSSKLSDFARQTGSFALAQVGVAGLQQALGTALQFATSSVQATLQMQGLQSAFKAIEGSGSAAASTMGFLRQTADRLGVEFTSLATGFKTIDAAARGTSLQGQAVRDVFTAMAEASRVLGLSTQDTNGVLLAIGQSISKGTVQAEELRGQIGERLPGAFQIAARAMGVTTTELGKMMEAGELQATTFWPRFADQIRKELGGGVEEASASASAAFGRFETAMNDLKITTGTVLVPALTWIIDKFNAVVGAAGKATQALNDYDNARRKSMQETRELAGTKEPLAIEADLNAAKAEADQARRDRQALQQFGGGLLGNTEQRIKELQAREEAAQARVIALERQVRERGKQVREADPLGEGPAIEPGARDEKRVAFLEKINTLSGEYVKKLDTMRASQEALAGRKVTLEEELKLRQGLDTEVAKAVKGQDELVRLYRDNPALKSLAEQARATEALGKKIADQKDADQERTRAKREADAQEKQDAAERLEWTRKLGQAAKEHQEPLIDLLDEMARKTLQLTTTEEQRFAMRVEAMKKDFPLQAQALDNALAQLQAAEALNRAQKDAAKLAQDRNQRLADQAATSKQYLDDVTRLERQLEPSRRGQTLAEQHADTLADLERRLKPEDRPERMARARKTSADTLAGEHQREQMKEFEQVSLNVLDHVADAIEKFTKTGKLSFKEMIDSILADFMRFSMQSLSKMAVESNWWQGLMKSAAGLMGSSGTVSTGTGGLTSGTLPTSMAQYEQMSAAGMFSGMQHGGPVTAMHPYMVGEAGPELFVPKVNGAILPHGQTPMPGPPPVNVYITTNDADSFRRSRDQVAVQMGSILARSRRNV